METCATKGVNKQRSVIFRGKSLAQTHGSRKGNPFDFVQHDARNIKAVFWVFCFIMTSQSRWSLLTNAFYLFPNRIFYWINFSHHDSHCILLSVFESELISFALLMKHFKIWWTYLDQRGVSVIENESKRMIHFKNGIWLTFYPKKVPQMLSLSFYCVKVTNWLLIEARGLSNLRPISHLRIAEITFVHFC